MKTRNCLTEQDLILSYYKELPATSKQALHLADCDHCKERLTALEKEMAALPQLAQAVDQHAATRMAARVTEQLKQPRRNWRPAIGTSAIAALALVLSISFWSPQQRPEQTAQITTSPLAANLDEEMPDIDFLEDLELLKELELLSQIEGV
jgi:anti-sigma factor RsiW